MEWKTTWSYLPIDYNYTLGTIKNVTQKSVFLNNIDGDKIKLKLSNKYGKDPLFMERVVLTQKRKRAQSIDSFVVMTKDNHHQICLQPGEESYTDEMEYEIVAGSELMIHIYFKEQVTIQSVCATWSAKSWKSCFLEDGDFTNQSDLFGKKGVDILKKLQTDDNIPEVLIGLSQILVLTSKKVKTIVLFGDSITHMSYYFDALQRQLYEAQPEKVTLINRGIGGNKLLHDASYNKNDPGQGKCFGNAALKRFEEDVYSTETPEIVFLLEGVNDIMHPDVFSLLDESVDANMLSEGITSLVAIAKKYQSKIFLGTITPFGGYPVKVRDSAEEVRKAINEWIRTQEIADGYFDFSKEIESKSNTRFMQEEYHLGDGLHPNTKGGEIMAKLVLECLNQILE